MASRSLHPVPVCLMAAAALAVAMGIGRFAFTPMLPLMVRDGSLSLDVSPWLAAANYLGYLVGALSAGRLPLAPARSARLSLVGIALTTAAMGSAATLPAWLLLRALAGVFSGWALVGVSAWSLHELARLGRPRLAAFVYAGVGSGIALTGLFCLLAAGPGVSAATLWFELGGLALAAGMAPLLRMRGGPEAGSRQSGSGPADAAGLRTLILCYGVFGFGYILPATYLPAMAHQMTDDPRVFGLIWPVFGAAAAVSTVLAGQRWIQANRLRAWALCHLAMAVGALWPGLQVSPVSVACSALLIGGTFMVITMLGLQEARLRAPDQVARALGRMTAAFSLGQLAGPLILKVGHAGSLHLGLQAAASGLLISAVPLWRLSHQPRTSP